MLKNFYVAYFFSTLYTFNSSLKSWGIRLVTCARCYRKTPSAVKTDTGSSTFKEACICTRLLAGNSSLWSVITNAISLGKSGRVEAGMRHKSFYDFL